MSKIAVMLAGALASLLGEGCKETSPLADAAAVDTAIADSRGVDRGAPDVGVVRAISFTPGASSTIVDTTSEHLAFPSITPLKDGRILLAYRRGASHVDATGRIMKQIGSADGSTWSAPEVLVDQPGIDDRDPSLHTLAGGDVVLSYFQYMAQALADGTLTLHHIFFSRSTDSGQTFSAPVQVDPGPMSAPGASLDTKKHWVDGGQALIVQACSSPIVESGSQLIIPAYGGNALNVDDLAGALRSRISLFVSADQGKSWKESPINPQLSTQTWLQEPSLLIVGKRQLLHVRTSKVASPGGAGYLAQAISEDAGATWSDFADLSFIGHAPDLYRLRNGVLLSAHRGLDKTYSKVSVAFVSSLDGGSTWSTPVVVEDCGSTECGYPSLLELTGDRLLVVYYGQSGKAIKQTTYSFVVQR
jgi:hypothetical protein